MTTFMSVKRYYYNNIFPIFCAESAINLEPVCVCLCLVLDCGACGPPACPTGG